MFILTSIFFLLVTGLNFQEKHRGQLAPSFHTGMSVKHWKLFASEKKLVRLATPAVATWSSELGALLMTCTWRSCKLITVTSYPECIHEFIYVYLAFTILVKVLKQLLELLYKTTTKINHRKMLLNISKQTEMMNWGENNNVSQIPYLHGLGLIL